VWDEQGMRYSWRVMVREKMGSITYRIKRFSDGRQWEINPSQFLQPRQYSEMSGQPDLITQFAYYAHSQFMDNIQKKRPNAGYKSHDFGIFVDAWVSLNGRPPTRIIHPDVNLIQPPFRSDWILPLPPIPPLSPFTQ
jgi:hypothetical protein